MGHMAFGEVNECTQIPVHTRILFRTDEDQLPINVHAPGDTHI